MRDGRRRARRGSFATLFTWRRALTTLATAAFVGLTGLADADPCVFSNGDMQVKIGEQTAVCLVISPLVWQVTDIVDDSYSQVLITPKADEFSRFSLTGSWQNISSGYDPLIIHFGENVGVHVESTGKYSYQKAFRRGSEDKTFPIFTAIISVDKGEVTGVSWDDGCHFCGSSRCQENTYTYDGELSKDSGKDCYWPDSECIHVSEETASSLCQLTVYVVWTGTDSEGNYFTSYAKRLSMYAGNSLDGYLDDAADKFIDVSID